MADLVGKAFRGGYAVPAFCTWNAESMAVVLGVAERLRAPVILMQGPGEFPVLPPAAMAAVARAIEGGHGATAALHLDHGDSMEMVRQCVEARYTSVMLDFSGRSFAENAAALRDVVALARPHGITVEGEIGKIGKADDSSAEGGAGSAYTDPADAVRYVKDTGVDLLAVSVGNKHGFYKGDPHLEFGLLAELHAAVAVPLVMHGGTGIPQKDIQRSITLGIAKVNVASELVHGYRASLTAQWQRGDNHWSPLAIAEAVKVMEPVVEKWIRITGAEGKA
jgi:fructose-bisphosphate aldolase class II/tagatose 1,6-diphosphate aldolase GatY/KbaY